MSKVLRENDKMNHPQNIDIDIKSVKKILIVRRGSLGDVLMITPFIN